MTQPETTPEMKQKEGEMAADTKRWLQQQPVTPEMKQRQMEAQKIQAALAIGVKFPTSTRKTRQASRLPSPLQGQGGVD